MSDPLLPDPGHPDDLALSGALDDVDDRGIASHLAACDRCAQRSAALVAARDAMRSPVTPLPPATMDTLIHTALAAAPTSAAERSEIAPVVALTPTSRGRLRVPPPSWLVGAAAAIAVLAGLAGLLRPTGSGDEALSKNLPDSAASGRTAEAESGGTPTLGLDAGGAAADPEAVGLDFGDQDDPDTLVAALESVPVAGGQTTSAARAGNEAADTAAAAPTASPPPAGPVAEDRAQCRDDAERIGAGRFGALVSTSTLRWAGRPAEVLVFVLTEPAGGVTRQALVLSRPGCALLADPRF